MISPAHAAEATSDAMKAAVLTVEEMYAADRFAADAGIPTLCLMEAAGMAVALEAMRLAPRKGPIAILCGPGNNGGDGFVAARYLRQRGWPVRLALLGSREALVGDARVNADIWVQAWRGEIVPLDGNILEGAALVIDALFGAGLSRPLGGAAAGAIASINARALPCLAVDIPSGVDGNTGEVMGIAPRCLSTVTFFRPKPGHLLYPGRAFRGALQVIDIGIPEACLTPLFPRCFLNGPAHWALPRLEWNAHKYTRGHTVVLAGEVMSGAARLATRGARRIGSGLVTLACAPNLAQSIAMDAPGALAAPLGDEHAFLALLKDERKNAYVLGPGGGINRTLGVRVIETLTAGRACVLDADALSVFASDPDFLFRATRQCEGGVVLTPHEGEFARLFHRSNDGSKLVRARQAAEMSGAVVLLKGPDTVVAAPDGRAVITVNAPPTLATAGAGDVLAGVIGGLLAQGMDGYGAACAAAWIHGEAARRFGPGLVAEDVADGIPKVLDRLQEGGSLLGR